MNHPYRTPSAIVDTHQCLLCKLDDRVKIAEARCARLLSILSTLVGALHRCVEIVDNGGDPGPCGKIATQEVFSPRSTDEVALVCDEHAKVTNPRMMTRDLWTAEPTRRALAELRTEDGV